MYFGDLSHGIGWIKLVGLHACEVLMQFANIYLILEVTRN